MRRRTYELSDAAPCEATVGREVTLVCQLNSGLGLVVEDLWTLSDTCSVNGGEGVAYTDVHDLHSGGESSAVEIKRFERVFACC